MLLKNFQSEFDSNLSNTAKYMNGTLTNIGRLDCLGVNGNSCHYGGGGYNAHTTVIGAGDTPVTSDDYDLADSSIMDSNKMASLSQMATWSRQNGAVITVQWINNSSEAITVKEIGLAFKGTYNAYSKAGCVLVARKVLSTPVTIQPGETYAFTYGIKV